ncbi:MAG: DUF4417 domain-containing protein [Muribaculaceae bacterium]|nr:DUF4417 domain-containing protein [Muribaculaceae bacterium]
MEQLLLFEDEFPDIRQIRRDNIKNNTYIMDGMSEHYKRKLRYENLHLSKGMNFTDEHGFAQVAPYNGDLPLLNQIYPYTERSKLVGFGQGLHSFVTDYQFAKSLWDRLYTITLSLSKFDLLFGPDYSFFVNPQYKFTSEQGIYRNRFITAYWQLCGLNVVPTATYGDVNSFKWCYEGLPKGSILAVGNETVHMSLRSSVTLWQWSIRELEEQKRPTMLLVYGKRIEVPGIQTPIQYIDGYINKYFRNGKNNQ